VSAQRRYLGSWTLPSGNSAVVYVNLKQGRLDFHWDQPPAPDWPAADVEHYRAVSWPEIVRALAAATGQRVLGVAL
jgi:hypothetical protein